MGPIMRFVFGCQHGATTVGRHLAATFARKLAASILPDR